MPQRLRRLPCSKWASDPVSARVPSSGAPLPGPSSARCAPTNRQVRWWCAAGAVGCRWGAASDPTCPSCPAGSPTTPTHSKQPSPTTMSGQQGEPPAEAAAGGGGERQRPPRGAASRPQGIAWRAGGLQRSHSAARVPASPLLLPMPALGFLAPRREVPGQHRGARRRRGRDEGRAVAD